MGTGDPVELDGNSPLAVLVYFRIDADEDGGKVFVNYEVGEPGKGTSVYRGSIHKIEAEDAECVTLCAPD